MTCSRKKDRFASRCAWQLVVSAFVLSAWLVGCEDTSRSASKSSGSSTTVARPANTAGADTAAPPWVAVSRRWPDTLRWTLNADDEMTQDGLLFRLRGSAIQSFVGGPKAASHPIMCWFEMTVRPIPTWPVAKGLALDSVVFRDPVRRVRLPALPMLSSERVYEGGTVRTRFTNNLSKRYTPDLTKGQMLEPTAYLTWDRRTIIVTARPIPIEFVHEAKAPPAIADSLQRWGPQ
jgi:hypothetical protein